MAGYLKNLMGEGETIDLIAHQHWFLLASAVLPGVAVLVIGLVTLSWAVWSAGPLPALGSCWLLLSSSQNRSSRSIQSDLFRGRF